MNIGVEGRTPSPSKTCEEASCLSLTLDYICNNDYRRKRYGFWIGVILAFVLAGAAIYSLPPDDPQGVQNYLDQR